MHDSVNPEMIILARELLGWTQSDLAREMNTTQATISRYEGGRVDVPYEHLRQLEKILQRPASFFLWKEEIYGASCMYHRRKQGMSAKELRRVHAQVNLLRIQATRLLRYTEVESSYEFHRIDVMKCGGSAHAAKHLRNLWQMPAGPVRNVVGAIERAGGIVFQCPFDTVKVDGISQWPLGEPELPPVFFVNVSTPGDRQRWTLTHEIGHVAMHHLPTANPEVEANEFASEFLMPAGEIGGDLTDMTLQKAAALKSFWKVSMQAIIYRSWQLGKISKDKYHRLFKEMGVKGYRKVEPVPMPAEEPRLLEEMIRVHRSTSNGTDAGISDLLGMTEDMFRQIYKHNLSGLRLVG